MMTIEYVHYGDSHIHSLNINKNLFNEDKLDWHFNENTTEHHSGTLWELACILNTIKENATILFIGGNL